MHSAHSSLFSSSPSSVTTASPPDRLDAVTSHPVIGHPSTTVSATTGRSCSASSTLPPCRVTAAPPGRSYSAPTAIRSTITAITVDDADTTTPTSIRVDHRPAPRSTGSRVPPTRARRRAGRVTMESIMPRRHSAVISWRCMTVPAPFARRAARLSAGEVRARRAAGVRHLILPLLLARSSSTGHLSISTVSR